MITSPEQPNPKDCFELPYNKYGFLIVQNADELKQVQESGYWSSVAVICPGCSKELVRSMSQASMILQNGCIQHSKNQ